MSEARTGERVRETKETRIAVSVNLDGSGEAAIVTGVGFYDHLLSSLAHHSLIDVEINAVGDTEIDDHHTVEDVALALGGAMIGGLERAALRRHTGAADGWVLACATGWGLSALGMAIPPDMSGEMPLALVLFRNGLLAPAAAGTILGIITGAALLRLLRRPTAS